MMVDGSWMDYQMMIETEENTGKHLQICCNIAMPRWWDNLAPDLARFWSCFLFNWRGSLNDLNQMRRETIHRLCTKGGLLDVIWNLFGQGIFIFPHQNQDLKSWRKEVWVHAEPSLLNKTWKFGNGTRQITEDRWSVGLLPTSATTSTPLFWVLNFFAPPYWVITGTCSVGK